MLVVKPEPYPKSKLPGGGRGSGLKHWDVGFQNFARSFIYKQNIIWNDRHTKFDLPRYNAGDLEAFDITEFFVWLYQHTDGEKRNPSHLVNSNHKIRHLAMVLRDNPDCVMDAADAFVSYVYGYRE
jgi:hypothetical protein